MDVGGGSFVFDKAGFTANGMRMAYPMHLNPDARHTLRMMQHRGQMTLWLDNMQVFLGDWPCVAVPLTLTGAKNIGFVGADDHAYQRSDFEAVYHAPCTVDAAMFLPCNGPHDEALCGFRPEDGLRLIPGADGGQDLLLGAGESVSYQVNVAQAGEMLLQLVFVRPIEGTLCVKAGDASLSAAAQSRWYAWISMPSRWRRCPSIPLWTSPTR